VQRARLALLLHEQPDLRSPAAARRIGQSTAWVCKWRRRWVEQGFSLQDASRPGRPPQFPDWTRILAFEAEYRRQPRPVRWKFTRQEFDRRLRELQQSTVQLAA
jgi:hypothetical protein